MYDDANAYNNWVTLNPSTMVEIDDQTQISQFL